MGRVARYKKVKSVDPFAKGRTWTDDVGNTANIRRVKKRSKTAQKLKDQKNKRFRGQKSEDDGFDLPPGGEDEFDMSDLMGSVKTQKSKSDDLLKGRNPILDNVVSKSSGDDMLSSKPERIDARGIKQSSSVSKQPINQGSSSNQSKKKAAATVASSSGSKGLEITAYTSTREIIAACSNPKSHQQGVDGTNSKQAKRKAFFQQKKLKKKNKRTRDDEAEDDDFNNPGKDSISAGKPSNQSRCAIDDQVERPPIFSTLPRGAASKKKKSNVTDKSEGQDEKADRIRKEQQNLEAMRQRVMAQYAILRESRRR